MSDKKSIIVRQTTLIEKKLNNGSGKEWVFVTTLNGRERAISFEELYYICRWIGECEDEKYPEYYHQGKKMVSEFMKDAVLGYQAYDDLAVKYKLPRSVKPVYVNQGELL